MTTIRITNDTELVMERDFWGWENSKEDVKGIIAFLGFVATWIYCIWSYGFLLGVGLGWLAAAVVAVFFYHFWVIGIILIVATLPAIFFSLIGLATILKDYFQ